MTTSIDLKVPSPPPVVPFERGGSPGQSAFLNQQAQINKQVALNKALAGGKKYKGGATASIDVQTIPSPYTSVYGPNFINNEQLKNAGTSGQSQLNSEYDKYATIKGGKRSKKRKTGRKKASKKKRKTARKRRTCKK
jgi:hypothetical protein